MGAEIEPWPAFARFFPNGRGLWPPAVKVAFEMNDAAEAPFGDQPLQGDEIGVPAPVVKYCHQLAGSAGGIRDPARIGKFVANGLSTTTCLPARSAAIACSACKASGLDTTTRSIPVCARTSPTEGTMTTSGSGPRTFAVSRDTIVRSARPIGGPDKRCVKRASAQAVADQAYASLL